jgi:hypothetical protein
MPFWFCPSYVRLTATRHCRFVFLSREAGGSSDLAAADAASSAARRWLAVSISTLWADASGVLQAETAGLKRQVESLEREAAARDAALASMQRAVDDGGARRDAESRGRAEHQAASAELAYKRAQGLADDLMKTNHALETLRRDGDAKAAGMEMAIKRLEAQLGAEAGFVNRLRDEEQEHVSSTAMALRGLEAQQLKLASGLAELGERLAAEAGARAAEAPALLSRAAEHTRAVAADTLAQAEARTGAAERAAAAEVEELRRLVGAVRGEGEARLGTYARKDAQDKKRTVERLLTLERTLREVHETRAAGDKAAAQAIEASHMRLAQLLTAERTQREGKERKLREQVQQVRHCVLGPRTQVLRLLSCAGKQTVAPIWGGACRAPSPPSQRYD